MASEPPASEADQRALMEDFPGLHGEPFAITSPATEDHNCFSHAVGRTGVWLWPEASSHWLAGVPREDTIAAVTAGLRLFGFEPAANADHEPGVEKVCIYAKGEIPQHVARQLPGGEWTSKLGRGLDLTHTLAALAGELYGTAAVIMQRRASMASVSPDWEPPLRT